jgi:two-component system, OmpR family, sensor kinase
MSRAFSLRTRLVAVAVCLVTLGVVSTGLATWLTLRNYLSDQLDRQVNDFAPRASFLLTAPPDRRHENVTDAELALVLADGTLLPASIGVGDEGLTLSQRDASRVLGSASPVSVSTKRGAYRVVDRPAPQLGIVTIYGSDGSEATRDLDGASLLVGLPESGMHSTLTKLVGLEMIVGTIVVAAAGVLSGLGVRLGLRPLDRVTRTAREVAEELSPDGSGLDKRVPVTDPHTEVGQLAVAVNTMLDTVETEYGARYESEQRMRRFLADASHELRTPLTSLRGYAELIRLRDKESGDPDSRDALRRIEAEGTRMSRLVDDLLTLARHDRGAVPEWEPVDLVAVVADAVAGVHAAHPERSVALTDPGRPAVVLGDRDQLLQVVRNVLTNAATHTPDGPITAAVRVAGAEVVVTVADTGPGLPPEQAAQVFDRFWRAESGRTRARGGSGLGMSIVSALLSAHGGRVTFDSTVEAGTTVTIRLPLAVDRQPAAPPVPAQERVNTP